jgi:cell wall-associated NlpC family hydrolase
VVSASANSPVHPPAGAILTAQFRMTFQIRWIEDLIMPRFARHRTLRGRRAVLFALGALPGCARPAIRLDVSPARAPSVRATVGPVTVVGSVPAGGFGDVSTAALPRVRHRTLPPATASASAARVLATAKRYVGTRYVYGGERPAEGFDCSGFVQYVFGRHGIDLPRTSALQASAGRAVPVALAALHPGDLMFFDTEGEGIDHVAIYAGNGRIIHASSGSGRVRYDDVDTDRGEWFLQRFVASRRVLGEG